MNLYEIFQPHYHVSITYHYISTEHSLTRSCLHGHAPQVVQKTTQEFEMLVPIPSD